MKTFPAILQFLKKIYRFLHENVTVFTGKSKRSNVPVKTVRFLCKNRHIFLKPCSWISTTFCKTCKLATCPNTSVWRALLSVHSVHVYGKRCLYVLSISFSYQLLLLLFKKSCSWSLILKSKYCVDTVYVYFYAHSNLQAFIHYIIFQIIYIIRIFTIFPKVTEMPCFLWGNIHLHIIISLQYLPSNARHFAFTAVAEAGKNGIVWLDLAVFNYWVGGFILKNYGNTASCYPSLPPPKKKGYRRTSSRFYTLPCCSI